MTDEERTANCAEIEKLFSTQRTEILVRLYLDWLECQGSEMADPQMWIAARDLMQQELVRRGIGVEIEYDDMTEAQQQIVDASQVCEGKEMPMGLTRDEKLAWMRANIGID